MMLPLLALLMFAPGDLKVLTKDARTYEMVELAVDAGGEPKNPFAPGEARLDATVTTPSGRRLRVPGFWYQEYRRSLKDPAATGKARVEMLAKVGAAGWRLRFASSEIGTHRIAAEWKVDGRGGRSGPVEVRLTAGAGPGFVRVSERNPHFLEHETRRPFFAIGENLCMYEAREGTYYFDRIFDKIAAGGGNYVRL